MLEQRDVCDRAAPERCEPFCLDPAGPDVEAASAAQPGDLVAAALAAPNVRRGRGSFQHLIATSCGAQQERIAGRLGADPRAPRGPSLRRRDPGPGEPGAAHRQRPWPGSITSTWLGRVRQAAASPCPSRWGWWSYRPRSPGPPLSRDQPTERASMGSVIKVLGALRRAVLARGRAERRGDRRRRGLAAGPRRRPG